MSDIEETKPLIEMDPHQLAQVVRVEAADDDMERLMAMGVCSGRTVEVVQTGDPLILKVFGSRVGVSARLAKRVFVTTCAADDCMGNVPQEAREDEDEA